MPRRGYAGARAGSADEASRQAVNPPGGLIASAARVSSFAVANTPTGQVWAWGRGQQGELGNGASKSRYRPVRVLLPRGVKVGAVRAGFEFAVALTTTGRVLTWGFGDGGALGNGRMKSSDRPVWVDLPRG